MRKLACPLFRWLIVARCQLRLHRQYEAEFPAAIAHPLERISRSSRAAGRASFDALRPSNHQKFIKNKHEILYVREIAPPVTALMADQPQEVQDETWAAIAAAADERAGSDGSIELSNLVLIASGTA